jgi:hypothetical protein
MGDIRASLHLKDEEDLLQYQEAFLQEMQSSSSTPAAKVMRVAPPAILPGMHTTTQANHNKATHSADKSIAERDVVSLGLPSILSSVSSKPAASRPSKFAQSRTNSNIPNKTQISNNNAPSTSSAKSDNHETLELPKVRREIS